MTRPCVRCGRSIGEALCECIDRSRWSARQWMNRDEIPHRGTTVSPDHERMPWRPNVGLEVMELREHVGWCQRESPPLHLSDPAAMALAFTLENDRHLARFRRKAPTSLRMRERNIPHVFRAIDGWLYELTGDLPE